VPRSFFLPLLFLPAVLCAQNIRGRVIDAARQPLVGALIELRDDSGKPLQIVLTTSSGSFDLVVPAPGRYRYRVAAIGYQPRPYAAIEVPAAGLVLPDLILQRMALRLPDLVAIGRGRFCGKSSLSDDIFDRLLESAHSALQIMETTIKSGRLGFQVAVITTSTLYGYNNLSVADTSIEPLARWPIQSIDPDTLRVVGFGRTIEPGNEGTREYYGPDARVLFSDWFLDSHCFSVDKPKKKGPTDSLVLRFTPARKSKLIDIGGELVLDAHDLALLEFSFRLTNLPNWMPEEAAGGYMQFSRLESGLWMTRTWSIWAPRAGISPNRRGVTVAGVLEKFGWVTRVYSGNDTIVVRPR
jgi:hypothetical protein